MASGRGVSVISEAPITFGRGSKYFSTNQVMVVSQVIVINQINHNTRILTQSKLSPQIERIPPEDSFHTAKQGN